MKKLLTLSLVVALLLVSSVGALAEAPENLDVGTTDITITPTIETFYPGTVDLELVVLEKDVTFVFEKVFDGEDDYHYVLDSVSNPVYFTLTNKSKPGEGSDVSYEGKLDILVNASFAGGDKERYGVKLSANESLTAVEPNSEAKNVYVAFTADEDATATQEEIDAGYETTIAITVTKVGGAAN